MAHYPKLNFPPIDRATLRRAPGGWEVVDPRRGRLKLTPEEWVRRHVIAWLEGLGFAGISIVQEYPVCLNGRPQRADLVVVDGSCRPLLLVECKEPAVVLTREVMDQAVCYNQMLQAPWVLLTNGISHCRLSLNEGRYQLLERFPFER